jgi:beta-lactamase class A
MFPLASVFKVAVAVTAYRLAEQHKLDLNANAYSITAADFRHGASPIADAHPRGNVEYLRCGSSFAPMLVDSDNTACDAVFRQIGGPAAVEDTLRSLGIADVRIRKTEADLYADALAHRSFARGGDNVGTPEAIARLLEAVAGQRAAYLDGTTELMLDLSAARTGATRFRAGLPPAVRLAHKTGLSDTFDGVTDATNDAGIFLLPDGRRVVVVALLAESRADAATRDAVLADVARTVYAAYAP